MAFFFFFLLSYIDIEKQTVIKAYSEIFCYAYHILQHCYEQRCNKKKMREEKMKEKKKEKISLERARTVESGLIFSRFLLAHFIRKKFNYLYRKEYPSSDEETKKIATLNKVIRQSYNIYVENQGTETREGKEENENNQQGERKCLC